MSDEEINKKIRDKIESIFPSPEVASRVVDLVVADRPKGWSRRSNAPYYKEMYARQIKADVDAMIETGKDIVYRYATWCDEESGVSKQTLYVRINQSIRYLVEKMDTSDHQYYNWYQTVHIQQRRGLGIVIAHIVGFGKEVMKGEMVEAKESMPKWKQLMEDWLESDNITPFHLKNLALTPEEISQLKIEFAQLHSVMASITSSEIKIIKVNE